MNIKELDNYCLNNNLAIIVNNGKLCGLKKELSFVEVKLDRLFKS